MKNFLDHPSTPFFEPHPSSLNSTELKEQDPFSSISVPTTQRIKQIWAVGGGKGGVGKSLIASSLAISLARQGHQVTTIDLDLGGANLHTTLGVDLPRQSLSDYIGNRVDRLEECVVPTEIPRLSLISGAQDAIQIANIQPHEKIKALQGIAELEADYIILDLGAGTSLHTIDFFLFADIGVVTLLPEPTSIENGYRFIKSSYFRRLSITRNLTPVRNLIQQAMDSKNQLGIRSPSDLFRELNRISPEYGLRMKEELDKFRPKLIINQARTQTDVDIGFSVKTVVKRYFGLDMDYVGYLDYDSAVWQAVRRKRPLMLEFPNSKLVSSIDRITQFLVKRHGHQRNDLW